MEADILADISSAELAQAAAVLVKIKGTLLGLAGADISDGEEASGDLLG